MLMPCPCAANGWLYCEKKDVREVELHAEEEDGSIQKQGEVFLCRELQMVDTSEWRRQQELDVDLQPVLRWVETQQ